MRIKKKINFSKEFEDLIEFSYYNSYKGAFLPLTINFNLKKGCLSLNNEHYLRMLRLPLTLYKRVVHIT
jgi:hypothetical protein